VYFHICVTFVVQFVTNKSAMVVWRAAIMCTKLLVFPRVVIYCNCGYKLLAESCLFVFLSSM